MLHIQSGPISIPGMFYGTASKEEKTADFVLMALNNGFRAIDSSNHPLQYHEEGVGKGLERFYDQGFAQREDLFLQSKFSFARHQDERTPFDPSADITTQVLQSFEITLANLRTSYLDSLILHGPAAVHGFQDKDFEAWQTLESLAQSERVRHIGLSGYDEEQLQLLLKRCAVKPAFVQNRCFAHTEWDADVRDICRSNGIVYQGFGLLTGNTRYLLKPSMQKLARKHDRSIPQLVYRFCYQKEVIVLNGTTNVHHMKDDLDLDSFLLSQEELDFIERRL